MALLKAFVSSTCYDLNVIRTQLRSFLISLGHEPVMSEHHDVLFDPRDHTHENCIKEIGNADVVILIIGSRYGGTAIPKAVNTLDIEALKSFSKSNKLLDNPEKISITQLEILKAIESNIPIFTFVDSKVMHDHLFYEKNKDKGILESIDFPSIDKKESAIYIFELINFIRLRSKNNSIIEFTNFVDIEDYLKRQWSALLQQLLYEQRISKNETKRLDSFSEELKDIKSLILSSISTKQAKEVGRGVIKYRKVIEFIFLTQTSNFNELLVKSITWDELMREIGITEIVTVETEKYRLRNTIYLIKEDRTFYDCRYTHTAINRIATEWESFRKLEANTKENIIEALVENFDSEIIVGRPLRYRNYNFDEFLKAQSSENEEFKNSSFYITNISNYDDVEPTED